MKTKIAAFLSLIISVIIYIAGLSLLDTLGTGQNLGIKTAFTLFLMAIIVELFARFGLSNTQFTNTRDVIAFILGVLTASIIMAWGQYQTQNITVSLFPYWILAVCGLIIVSYIFSSDTGRNAFFKVPSRDKLDENSSWKFSDVIGYIFLGSILLMSIPALIYVIMQIYSPR